jgi:hypothetical protein
MLAYYGQADPLRQPARSVRVSGAAGRAAQQPQLAATGANDGAARAVNSSDGQASAEKRARVNEGEIDDIEANFRAILAKEPIEQWRFEAVRSRYLTLLKRTGDDPALEEAIRVNLARVTRYEQAAESARSLRAMLDRSHARDREVARALRRTNTPGRSLARAYSAVGFMQPSDKSVDGRKLYVLVANNGSTVAYLDIPPGLDPSPLIAQRVGVRGVPNFNEDLGTRLITVRDVETVESRR